MSLVDILRQRAADPADSDRVYLFFEDERFTFGETFIAACRFAKTKKILKRELRHEGFLLDRTTDPIYRRERGEEHYRRFNAEDLEKLLERFHRAGTSARLEL